MSLPVPSTQDDTVDLTIRFSASLPDLPLSISLTANPHANTSTLKQLIRQNLPAHYATKRIRLIYSGKALLDDAPLSTTLKRPSRPSTPLSSSISSSKGKTPLRDPPLLPSQRIYVHCSLGDLTLTPDEVSAEARLAHPTTSSDPSQTPTRPQNNASTTTPAPRGFDRLTTAGFSPSEIASLRLQFLSIQSHTHTPDTMPSPTTLRQMEDAWLDSSDPTSFNLTSSSTDQGAGAGGVSAASYEETEQSALDDMIYGTAMGFFWPVGCLMWGVREEGVWSARRKMAVIVGVLLNIGLGIVRFSG